MGAGRRCLVSGLFLIIPGLSAFVAAQRLVLADAVTHDPIAHVSLYTKEANGFHSCISNEQGVANVTFAFQRLTISHLNYEKRVVRRLQDTIFLHPRLLSKAEVIITNKEPEWIRRCLKQAVKQKEQRYFSHSGYEAFDYRTQSLGSNNLYQYRLTGLLRMKDNQHNLYAVAPDTGQIVAVDTTSLTDTANLRRMLYEDFIAEMDNGFIRSHRFFHNADYQGHNNHEVELHFRAKKGTDDRGWLVIDTLSCHILSAYRFTGTKTNRSERIDGAMYALSRVFGYRIDKWTRDYWVTYKERADGSFYPAEVRYKVYYAGRDGDYDKKQADFHEQTGGGFPNMEATLTLSPTQEESDRPWVELPKSWYITFNTDKKRQQEIELSNLPATFTIFEDEP